MNIGCLVVFCLTLAWPGSIQAAASNDRAAAVLRQLDLLNQVPPDQLSEKEDPGFSILKDLYDQDAPDFSTLRRALGAASVRSSLNPSVKAVLAGILSARWDTFTLSGNLWLAALRSPNPDFRDKARKRLVYFIQPAHIPALIDLLRSPEAKGPAHEILQEVTGRPFGPDVNKWRAWWTQGGGAKADLVGHLLKDTKLRLQERPIANFDEGRFWRQPEKDQITAWNEWVNTDVRSYVEGWSEAKPILDRVVHQPDPRVSRYLERLAADPGMGDYASVVLAWRGSETSLPALQEAYQRLPTVGRALARGSLGDKEALRDLLKMIEKTPAPLSFSMMDDTVRSYAKTLRTVGVIPAEQAFSLLTHHTFGFEGADTPREKRKILKQAQRWLDENWNSLSLDRGRGYYAL